MNVQIIFSIIGALLALIAVVLIYNARKIVRERFSFGDQNSGALAVKTIGMVLFCVGMFTVHTVSTGLANSMKESQKSLTSGMYLSFYYLGGALGSFLPSIIYEKFGWNVVIYMFCIILLITFILVISKRKLF